MDLNPGLHCEEAGAPSAPALILIHGFMVDGPTNWAHAIPELARDFRVICVDVRGHGQSPKPHADDAYGPELALDMIRLLDRLGIEQAHIAGYSMGAMIALYLAARHPERLRSAVVGGFGPTDQDFTQAEAGDLTAAVLISVLDKAIQSGRDLPDILIEQNTPLAAMPEFKYEPILDFYEEMRGVSIDPVALRHAFGSLGKLLVTTAEAAGIRVPLLAISGDHDPAFDSIVKLRSVNPKHTAVAIVPDYGHINAYLSPAFISMMRCFLIARSHSK